MRLLVVERGIITAFGVGFSGNISDGEHSYTMSPLGGLALAAMAIVVLASLVKADIPAQPTGQPSQGTAIIEP
jgi:hypothetical protein